MRLVVESLEPYPWSMKLGRFIGDQRTPVGNFRAGAGQRLRRYSLVVSDSPARTTRP